MNKYDVIIVGGGHAGCEAAYAIAKLSLSALLITHNKSFLGKMSCNPAIGGLAKGHIVREIDALGGLMGKFADKTGIQFRMLNLSKGPAVWGPRAQIDKVDYMNYVSNYINSFNGINIFEGSVENIIIENKTVSGVVLKTGVSFYSKSVILTAGTFLNGLIHIGDEQFESGRINEESCLNLSSSLIKHGFKIGRLKTGTPARIKKDSIDYCKTIEQIGDKIPQPFSFSTNSLEVDQVSCFLTKTSIATKNILEKNIDLSPMGRGYIKSTGPRYCPSIETKLINFPDKDTHQIFIEPEGRDHPNIYLNGFSNCFPLSIQKKLVQSILGLEDAIIDKPAYAIEYDYLPPVQLKPTLETKLIKNLFFAGQINGTSGYEEAAAQGLMAGINSALSIKKRPPFILLRSEAYIGVLIDDLITKGTNEPYRMFTSRAEFRLLLRQDNADERLMEKGYNLGLVEKSLFLKTKQKIAQIYSGIEIFKKSKINKEKANKYLSSINKSTLTENSNIYSLLKRPEINFNLLDKLYNFNFNYSPEISKRIEILIKYSGYIKKQIESVDQFEKFESLKIPDNFNYNKIQNLSNEAKEKLNNIKPVTIGQANRISGINPSDIQIIIIFLKSSKTLNG